VAYFKVLCLHALEKLRKSTESWVSIACPWYEFRTVYLLSANHYTATFSFMSFLRVIFLLAGHTFGHELMDLAQLVTPALVHLCVLCRYLHIF